jgi:hypothetical protein
MPLTAAQIVAQCCSEAGVPGFVVQAGIKLNAILQELAMDYDFAVIRKTFQFNMPTVVDVYNRNFMNFPTDYLRALPDECFYYINGVPYSLIPVDLSEFDNMVSQAGLSNFSTIFAVDISVSPPIAYFWMASNGAYPAILRYQSLPADIVTPQTSATIPWFPNQTYLMRRLTGELCVGYDDDRAAGLLGDDDEKYPGGAGTLLRKYVKMKDDNINRAKVVKLDRRRFGGSFQNLRNTKLVGW